MGNEFKDSNIFIEVTMVGSKQKTLVRVDRIKEVSYLPDGMVFINTERDLKTGTLKGFPVLEGYETVIELCIRAGLQIIRKE